MATALSTAYLPFQPKKNQEFTLYLSKVNGDGDFDHSSLTVTISKDGASPISPSNGISTATTGVFSLTLTASEMNADSVQVIFNGGSTRRDMSIVIYTSGTNFHSASSTPVVSAYAPSTLTTIVRALDKGYSFSKIATNESGFNYYGLTQDKGSWWIIIREKDDFSETKYAMRHIKKVTFDSGWSNRSTISYADNIPITSVG